MTWYEVTPEIQDNIRNNGTINNWMIERADIADKVYYSSLMPKPGDYLKIISKTYEQWPNWSNFSLIFSDCYDIVWVNGRITLGEWDWYHIEFRDCDNNVSGHFGAGHREFWKLDEINSNIGKAFISTSISGLTGNTTEFTFRILGRNSGVSQSEYLVDNCNNIIQEQTSIASFDGSLIPEAFRKTEQGYYTYYTPFIKVGGQYYIWKNLTEGYVLYVCTVVESEEPQQDTEAVCNLITELFPQLSDGSEQSETILATLQAFCNNPVLAELVDFGQFIELLFQTLTGNSSINLLDILEGFGDVIGASLGDIGETIERVIDNFTLEIRQILNSIYNNNGDLVAGLKDYVDNLITTNNSIAENIQQSNREASTRLDRVSEAMERLLSTSIANPVEFVANAINLLMELMFSNLQFKLDRGVFYVDDIVDRAKNTFKNDVEKLYNGVSTGIEKLATGEIQTLDQFEKLMENAGVNTSVWHLGQAVFSFIPALATMLGSNLLPIQENLRQVNLAKFRPTLNEPTTLIAAYYKGFIGLEEVKSQLSKMGLSDERITILIKSALPLLSPDILRQAYLRGLITHEEHARELSYYGFDAHDILLLEQLYQQIPPIQDIIRFSVREAFSPEIAEKFGQYEDYPEKVEEYARLLGLSSEFSKMYWASHWDLPSPTMGYEMLHRGIINKDELKLLLRALDIMPYWRDKLIQLSYRPLTRVDVRRMYGTGVIDRGGVLKAYKDIGYDDYNAELMTQFTVTYEAMQNDDGFNERKHLTRSIIELAFSRGVISEADALSRLINLGYVPQDASLLLNVVKYKELANATPSVKIEYRNKTASFIKDAYLRRLIIRPDAKSKLISLGYSDIEAEQELNYIDLDYNIKIKTAVINYVKKAYTERTLSLIDAQAMLTSFGFTGTEQERLFDEMNLVRELRTNKPTYAQFKSLAKRGIITTDQFIEELRGLGYHDKYVEMLVELELGE